MGNELIKRIRTDDERFVFEFRFLRGGENNDNCAGIFLTLYYLTPRPPQREVEIFASGKCDVNSIIPFSVREIKVNDQYYEACIYGEVTVRKKIMKSG
ncbi:MAG: hypothetical protein GY757_39845 [bacterium]|nr:hypothetical protein [bacterium]